MTDTPLPTRNAAWGFYGTMNSTGHDAEAAWTIASRKIAEATGATDPNAYGPEGIRDWLDSRDRRHFADMVADREQCLIGRGGERLATAIKSAIATYQGWSIGPKTEREHGIPRGLPYLTGWIQHYAIQAELHDATAHP